MARKHTIIVGGTKGVGRELAVILANEGQLVTAVGRAPGEFPEVTGGGQIRSSSPGSGSTSAGAG